MGVLRDVLNSWAEGICVHRIYYNKPDMKSAMITTLLKSVKVVRLELAPSCISVL